MSTSSCSNNSFDDSEDYIQDGKRRRLSQEDAEILLQAFNRNPKPNKDERNELSSVLGMNSRTIQIWFQNRRAKLKKESNDPDLFTKKTIKEFKNREEIIILPQVTARNFKELCLPKYLDIPIKGQQLSTEDMTKYDAIRRFWQKEQEKTNEINNVITTATAYSPPVPKKQKFKKFINFSPSTSPPQHDNQKKTKPLPRYDDMIMEDSLSMPVNMPDIIPFTDISNKSNDDKPNPITKKLDYTNLSFLTQSIKEINSLNIPKLSQQKPNLDSVATNLDFLFDPNRNSGSLDMLGSTTRNQSNQNLDQVFSDFFASFPDMNN